MAITAVTPVSGSSVEHGDSFSFTVDNTYTTLQIKVQTSVALEKAYDTALSGAQAGYTITVTPVGGTDVFVVSRDAGWDTSPQVIYVEEDETGTLVTTNINYLLASEQPFPQGSYPYNPKSASTVVSSFAGRDSTVVPTAGDYDAFYYTEAEVDALVAGAGDLVGPASATDHAIARYDTTTGKLVQNSEVTIEDDGSLYLRHATSANMKMVAQTAQAGGGAATGTWWSKLDGGTYTRPMFTDQSNNQTHIGRIFELAAAPGATHGENWGIFEGDTLVDTTANIAYVCLDSTNGASVWKEVGDVSGPASATTDMFAIFNGTTGKSLKNGIWNGAMITANNAKVSYTDAAAVGLNTTHRTSDGKNHADVVTNNAKISYTDAAAVALNTAKLTNATHTGDVTGSGALTIGALKVATGMVQHEAVTNAKLAHMTQYTVKAKAGTGTGDPTDVGMATNSVLGRTGSGNIAGINVDTDHLVNNAVTLAKMAHGTDGNLITYDAAGAPAYVVTGTATHVLTSNGTGAAPTMQVIPTQDHGSLTGLSDDDHSQYLHINGMRAQDAVWFDSRASQVNTPVNGFSELWSRSATYYDELIHSDRFGIEWEVCKSITPTDSGIPYWSVTTDGNTCDTHLNFTYVSSELILGGTNNAIVQTARASGPTGVSSKGKYWTMTGAPSRAMFTDDDGYDSSLDTREMRLFFNFNVGATQNYWYTWNQYGPNYDVNLDHLASGGTTLNLTNAWMNPGVYFPRGAKIIDIQCEFTWKSTVTASNLDFYLMKTSQTNAMTAVGTESTVAYWAPSTFTNVVKKYMSGPWTKSVTQLNVDDALYLCFRRSTSTTVSADPSMCLVIRYKELD